MHASLMGCALESYVIDNDMLGSILSSLTPIEVSEATLAISDIEEVVQGEGDFLGRPDTLKRMHSDFVYPLIGNRSSIEEWQDQGEKDIREVAREKARWILDNHFPTHIPSEMDQHLRLKFDIRLAQTAMCKL